MNEKLEKLVYRSDASQIKGKVRKVVFPETSERIALLIRNESNIVPRGAGTGLSGGAVPLDSVVIDLSKMNKIIDIDKVRKIAYVEAGVILGDLNYELSKYRLEFPVQPGSFEICSIGGMIATNAVGVRATKYGRTSDWVYEIEVVTGNGEILKIRKLGMSDFSGMEGITGIITKAKLKLIDKPERSASLLKFSSLHEVEEAVKKLKMNKEISMIELIDRVSAKSISLDEEYYLIVEFESERGNLKGESYEALLKKRAGMYPALAGLGYTNIEDPKVMMPNLSILEDWLERRKIPFFGHIAEGILHPCFRKNQEGLVGEMMKLVKKIRGQISGEHGIGLKKKEFVDEVDRKILERIKKRYDPKCKLNCGKIIDMRQEVKNTEENKREQI